jgi:hypothetical protein
LAAKDFATQHRSMRKVIRFSSLEQRRTQRAQEFAKFLFGLWFTYC